MGRLNMFAQPSGAKAVGVFCGAKSGLESRYLGLAREFGMALGQRNLHLVYGSGGTGLMGAVANAAYATGSRVTRIVPSFLIERDCSGIPHGEIFVVGSIHQRKALMYQLSHAFVALPGGYGTFDELMEVAALRNLGLHCKPIILLNFQGFFDPFIVLMDHVMTEGFLGFAERAAIEMTSDIDTALDLLTRPILTLGEGSTADVLSTAREL